ncbi:MAG: PEP-CTERM sorting domain-containing protein [Cyanobacteria bacterium P01_E01_bin.42]
MALSSSVNNYYDEEISVKTIKTICQSLAGLAASAVLALGVAESASAFTLIYSESQTVTGISGLDIDGTKYDVEFIDASFNEVFGNVGDLTEFEEETPTFWGDEVGAASAGWAVGTALGDSTLGVGNAVSFVIPVQEFVFREGVVLWEGAEWCFVCGVFDSAMYGGIMTDEGGTAIAKFTQLPEEVESVPEPASTIAILAVAGTGMLATRKRKK